MSKDTPFLDEEDKRLQALYNRLLERVEQEVEELVQASHSEEGKILYDGLSRGYRTLRHQLRRLREEVLRGEARRAREERAREERIRQVRPGEYLRHWQGHTCQVIRWNRGREPTISVYLPDGTRKALAQEEFVDVIAPEQWPLLPASNTQKNRK